MRVRARVRRPPSASARGSRLALALATAAAALLWAACSDHRVSPWGRDEGPRLSPYVAAPDLDARLSAVDAETAALHVVLEREVRGQMPRGGGPLVIRAYRGHDAVGRTTHAVRVATARGVVMVVGPLDPRDPRDRATELVEALVVERDRASAPAGVTDGGAVAGPRSESVAMAFRSGTDLNQDGAPDIVLRAETGALEIWRLSAIGSVRYDVALAFPVTEVGDVDGDGRVDLAGRSAGAADAIAPVFRDVATFDGERYSNATPAARRWHAERAARALPPPVLDAGADGSAASSDAGTPAPEVPPPARLRDALERAWHRLRAGEPRKAVFDSLDREPVPAELRAAFEAHRRALGGPR